MNLHASCLLQVAVLYTHSLTVYVLAAQFILPKAGMHIFVSSRTYVRAQEP